MNLGKLALVFGLIGVCWSVPGRASPPEAPKSIKAEPSTAKSRELSTKSASAEISGDPQAALTLAERTIAADTRDPWGHYDKAAALARLGKTDEAIKSFLAAEERFAPSDLWSRSVAIYGGAHALAEAGRCDEAKREFSRYSAFVQQRDPKSAEMAERYAADCRTPAVVPSSSAPTASPPTASSPPVSSLPESPPPSAPPPPASPPPVSSPPPSAPPPTFPPPTVTPPASPQGTEPPPFNTGP